MEKVNADEIKERISDNNGFLKGLVAFGMVNNSNPMFQIIDEIVKKNQELYERIEKYGIE